MFKFTTIPLRRWFLRKWKKWVARRDCEEPMDVGMGSAPQVTLQISSTDEAEADRIPFSAARELKPTGEPLVCEGVDVSNSKVSDWRGAVRDAGSPHLHRRICSSIGKQHLRRQPP